MLENLVISTEYKAMTITTALSVKLENLVISTEYKANMKMDAIDAGLRTL